ncbi:hypothetical protein SKAU_G00190850 [Synaphobranchus kaupii]|uniref:Putative nuclease HARBI1 n=1 Tax=Synaphobranchus kaupii TaxID=118154 RepID=A0A9Q1IWU9_SYNKA|nr:hypothetical protein SKAU_G00190850 [Synaphobranchus kaupii]
MRRRLVLLAAFEQNTRGAYCQLNLHVPLLRLYFGGGDTKADFRLARVTLNQLVAALEEDRTIGMGWGKTVEVLVFLYWLASATSYRVVSEAFGIPRQTVNDMVHRVSKGIHGILPQIIRFPTGQELEMMGAGFACLAGSPAFQRTAGSIDVCHIRVVPPAGESQDYLNRKLFFSLQMQAVCDHRGKFLNVFTGYPGSVHDAQVLKCSDMYVHRQYPPQGWFLIGDGGYPCIQDPITLITPYREPVQGPVQARYNGQLSRARGVVERAFRVMKTRWRSIFLKALEFQIPFAIKLINCCAVLHNLCINNEDLVDPDVSDHDDDDDDDDDDYDYISEAEQDCGNHGSADELRAQVAAAASAPVG